MTLPGLNLLVNHQVRDLLLAGVFGAVASMAVFGLRSRMGNSRGLVRTAWIFLCGLEAGGAIWGAHFIGLLGYRPGVAFGFDTLKVLEALLVSVVASALAFGVAWSGREPLRLIAGGLLLTMAIGASHYMGVTGYVVAAHVQHEALTVWASMVAGLLFSIAALAAGDTADGWRRQVAGGGLLALGIGALHLIGVRAMTLEPTGAALPAGLVDGGVMALLVTTLALLMIMVGLCAAYIDDTGSREALARTRRLASASREGIVVLDSTGCVVDANLAFTRLIGEEVEALQGRRFMGELLTVDGGRLATDCTVEGALRPSGGDPFPVEAHACDLADSGSATLAVALRDLRERREAERIIRHLAEHDAMTGLMNRAALHRAIRAALERAAADAAACMVVCLNVDNSKDVNETLGHAAGDALLMKIAERLKRFEAEGVARAGRVGGNEFAVVVAGARGQGVVEASDMLDRLTRVLRRPFEADGQRIEPRVSVGVAGYPLDAQNVSDLLLHADLALKEARESGESFCFFSREYQNNQRLQRQLLGDLRLALGRPDELVVFYQPQAEAASGRICGFEALVRWRHPERGLLGPDRFIPMAEASGLIGALGEHVLRRACADAAAWPASVGVAVNLSALQLGDQRLVPLVHEVLIETGLSPSRLELEITETALTRDLQSALDTLRRLKALGVRIAMDDFGTGYSSLSTLHSFPFDRIKIDKSFVDGLGKLERSTVIVRSVLGIGRGLGIPVVAEGVETPAQREILRAEGCAELQGYLIGRPAPLEAQAGLLAACTGAQAHAA